MVKNILCLLAIIIAISGCASNNSKNTETPKIEKVLKNEKNVSDVKEKRIIYQGGYDLEFKKPRVFWFKPILTMEGNVLSERTLTVAPDKRKWTRKSKKFSSEKFDNFVNDTKVKELINEK